MSREKQIEEMAKIIADCEICIYRGDVIWEEEDVSDNLALCIARALYEQDYRKSSDVAEEIFAEIEEMVITEKSNDGCAFYLDKVELAELKKKYTEETDNAT